MYAQIITTKVSENANGRIIKWRARGRLGKAKALAGVIWKGFLAEVLFKLD